MHYNKFWFAGGLLSLGMGYIAGAAGLPPYTDRLAGRAAFRIERDGRDILMQPILTPHFKLEVLNGPHPLESEVVQCSVWGRELRRDAQEGQVITVTVLRCGSTEYGVSEVDFAFDPPAGSKQ